LIKWRRRVKPKTDGKNGGDALLICHIWSTKKKKKRENFCSLFHFLTLSESFRQAFFASQIVFLFSFFSWCEEPKMELALILLLSFYVVGISGREHVKGCELKFFKILKCGGGWSSVWRSQEVASSYVFCHACLLGKKGWG